MRLSDEKLRGRAVISADGHVIGRVVSLEVEISSWLVEAIGVELRRDIAERIGTRRSLFRAAAIEIPVKLIQSVGDTVVLSVALDALRRQETTPAAGQEAHA
jgi:sporulation protein YlmC with PRC-barrel domain